MSSIFARELNQQITTSAGERLSKQTVIVRQLVNKAATGDTRSQKMVLSQQQKAEKRQKGEMLMERMIKDRYLTHEAIELYLYQGKILEPDIPCASIACNMNLAAMNKRLTAQLCLLYALMLSDLWIQVIHMTLVISANCETQRQAAYWQGVKDCVSALQLPISEEKLLYEKIARQSGVSHPTEEQAKNNQRAADIVKLGMMKNFRQQLDWLKQQPGYEKEEKDFLKKGMHGVFLERERSTLSSKEFEEAKMCLHDWGITYKVAAKLPGAKEYKKEIKELLGNNKNEIEDNLKSFFKSLDLSPNSKRECSTK